MKVVMIGAGNVASSLCVALSNNNICVSQVYSRNISNAIELSQRVNAKAIDDVDAINLDVDMVIVCIKDDAIHSVLQQKKWKNTLLVHTAGSVNIDVLNDYSQNCGVLYPLQTFQKTNIISLKNIPVFIEANNATSIHTLRLISNKISNQVYDLDSVNRAKLHIGAVFTCNFVNYLYSIGFDIVNQANINPEVLIPLIQQTFENIKTNNPSDVQTGPAKRNDVNVIETHLKLLSYNSEIKDIYKLLTSSILNKYN